MRRQIGKKVMAEVFGAALAAAEDKGLRRGRTEGRRNGRGKVGINSAFGSWQRTEVPSRPFDEIGQDK
jgi:hypothetical protein